MTKGFLLSSSRLAVWIANPWGRLVSRICYDPCYISMDNANDE